MVLKIKILKTEIKKRRNRSKIKQGVRFFTGLVSLQSLCENDTLLKSHPELCN